MDYRPPESVVGCPGHGDRQNSSKADGRFCSDLDGCCSFVHFLYPFMSVVERRKSGFCAATLKYPTFACSHFPFTVGKSRSAFATFRLSRSRKRNQVRVASKSALKKASKRSERLPGGRQAEGTLTLNRTLRPTLKLTLTWLHLNDPLRRS